MKAYRLTQHLMAIILIVAIAIGLLPAVALGAERSSAIPVEETRGRFFCLAKT